jgi:hypothetical protein
MNSPKCSEKSLAMIIFKNKTYDTRFKISSLDYFTNKIHEILCNTVKTFKTV